MSMYMYVFGTILVGVGVCLWFLVLKKFGGEKP